MKKFKKIIQILLVTLLFFVEGLFAYASQSSEIIRVGYIDYDGYFSRWKYEYIFDSWSNCLDKLQNSQIDLISMAQYTDERDVNFHYSQFPIGIETSGIKFKYRPLESGVGEINQLKSGYCNMVAGIVAMPEVNKYRYSLIFIMTIVGLLIIFFHIINKKKANNLLALKNANEFRNMAERDHLTGLYNKEAFYEKAHNLIVNNRNVNYDIICLDISRFKVINDLFGIKQGDEILKIIATTLNNRVVGNKEICARLGADVFVLCVCDKSWIEKIQTDNSYQFMSDYPLEIQIIIKYGVYRVEDREMPVNLMCDRANMAVNSIKGNYLKHYAIYDDTHRQAFMNEQEILNDMQKALESGQFDVYLQPKCRIKDSKIIGCEALVRWFHPVKGKIPPGEFIPIFESNGFILKLDAFVWERACSILKKWKSNNNKFVPISVNISRANFYNPNLESKLRELIKRYNLSPSMLEFEITESAYTENEFQLSEKIAELKNIGFPISMDDFGSGYSSLNMLRELPVDKLKLDLQFLKGDINSQKGKFIMSAIISMAKNLEIPIIAEGVETLEQVNLLKEYGCDYAQGYYYSKPVNVDEFEMLLNSESDRFNLDKII